MVAKQLPIAVLVLDILVAGTAAADVIYDLTITGNTPSQPHPSLPLPLGVTAELVLTDAAVAAGTASLSYLGPLAGPGLPGMPQREVNNGIISFNFALPGLSRPSDLVYPVINPQPAVATREDMMLTIGPDGTLSGTIDIAVGAPAGGYLAMSGAGHDWAGVGEEYRLGPFFAFDGAWSSSSEVPEPPSIVVLLCGLALLLLTRASLGGPQAET